MNALRESILDDDFTGPKMMAIELGHLVVGALITSACVDKGDIPDEAWKLLDMKERIHRKIYPWGEDCVPLGLFLKPPLGKLLYTQKSWPFFHTHSVDAMKYIWDFLPSPNTLMIVNELNELDFWSKFTIRQKNQIKKKAIEWFKSQLNDAGLLLLKNNTLSVELKSFGSGSNCNKSHHLNFKFGDAKRVKSRETIMTIEITREHRPIRGIKKHIKYS